MTKQHYSINVSNLQLANLESYSRRHEKQQYNKHNKYQHKHSYKAKALVKKNLVYS